MKDRIRRKRERVLGLTLAIMLAIVATVEEQ